MGVRRVSKAAADIVIVHSSDLHVDDGYTARAWGGDGTGPLRQVLQAARAAAADVVLLAGDTFEHNRLPVALIDRAAALLLEAGIPTVILPGNHDPAVPDSVFHRGRIAAPPHVHVLGVTHETAVQFSELDLEIWGHAHRDYDDMAPLRRPRARSTRWQVAAAHGHYERVADRTAPLRPSWLIGDADLAATGADYVALGHWNTPKRVGQPDMRAYYSGSPDLAGTINVVRLAADGRVIVRRRRLG